MTGIPEQFPRLPHAAGLSALHACIWRERETALGSGYAIVARAFNDLEIAPRLILEPVLMSCGRTFPVLSARRSAIHRCATWSSAGRPAASTRADILWAPQFRGKVRDLAKQ